MKTYQGLMKGAALSVSFVAMALTVACGGSKGGSAAPAASAQCINGECPVGQYVAGFGNFQGRGTGRAYVNGAQGQETMLMTVASFTNTNNAQQYNNNYNYNYNQQYNSGSVSLSGSVNVRAGYALMLSQTSSNRSPSAVCYDSYGAYDCYTGIAINSYQQTSYTNNQYCDPRFYVCGNTGSNGVYGSNGTYGGSCQIPVGDYTITTISQGTSSGSSYYGGSSSFSNVRIRLTGPATIEATINNGSLGTAYGNQIGRFSGSMTIQTMNNVQCNTSVQIQ